jgi:hypothetical protein
MSVANSSVVCVRRLGKYFGTGVLALIVTSDLD